MAIKTESGVKRAMTRFEAAADAHAFRGTIPRFENEEAMAMYEAIEDEYEAAKKAILDFMLFAVRQL